jgi:hypothetical protein
VVGPGRCGSATGGVLDGGVWALGERGLGWKGWMTWDGLVLLVCAAQALYRVSFRAWMLHHGQPRMD